MDLAEILCIGVAVVQLGSLVAAFYIFEPLYHSINRIARRTQARLDDLDRIVDKWSEPFNMLGVEP